MTVSAQNFSSNSRPRRVEALVNAIARSQMASIACILIVALACFLPGFLSTPPIDGEEAAFAVAAREMAATGDYASVRLQTVDAERSPRGGYWVQAFTLALAPTDPPIWVHRLPSLVAAIAVCLLTWWTMLAFGRPRAALLAGLFTAAAGTLGIAARLATADAVNLAGVMLAMGALARVWQDRNSKGDDLLVLMFWTGLGVSLLAKGFVAPAMVLSAAAILSLERGSILWLRALKPAVGLFWFFFLIGPLIIVLILSGMQGSGDGPTADFLSRVGVPYEMNAPPGTYALLFPLLVGPVATYIFIALRWIFDNLGKPVVLFALAAGGPVWLGAELVSAKLPQTILPAIPFVSMLAAAAVDAGGARIGGRISWFYSLGPAIWPPLTALVLPLLFMLLERRFPALALIVLLPAAVLGPITWVWLKRGQVIASTLLAVITVIFIYLAFFGVLVPQLSALRVAERVGAISLPCNAPEYVVAGHPEESMVLVLGRGTRILDGWGAADFLNSGGCRVAAIDSSVIPSFRQRTDDLGLAVREWGRVRGFNLRKMRDVDLHVFTAEPGSFPSWREN